jgi:nicotinamidase-related amidase
MTPQRLTARHAALLIVDIQERLVAQMSDRDRVVVNARRLIRGAHELAIPTLATEQYPQGLGPTAPELSELLPSRPEKRMFHCCACPQILEQLHGRMVRHVTLAGIEAHVCVAQTALELLGLGFLVQVAADAVASRHRFDWEIALRRLEHAGVVVSTTEAILFEWIESADHPKFKAISQLVKEVSPAAASQANPS